MNRQKANYFSNPENISTRISYDDEKSNYKIAFEIMSILPNPIDKRPVVFMCIGTDRSTGDSLGPLVGTFLEERDISPFYVYGTLDNPIHAVNLKDKINEITNIHHNPFIIAIDACLGRLKNIGIIQIGKGPVKPGAGVNKELPEVGDYHITGIVNVSGFMEYFVLQNTRLNLVLKMAKVISDGIYRASKVYDEEDYWIYLNDIYNENMNQNF